MTDFQIGDLVTVDTRLYPREFHGVVLRITKKPTGARGVNYTAEPVDGVGRGVRGRASDLRRHTGPLPPARTVPTHVLPYPLDEPRIEPDRDGRGRVSVRFTFKPTPDLDRLDAYAWGGLPPALANRLVDAVKAGVVLRDGGAYTDRDGRRGVHVFSVVGRTLSTDLARLGF